MIDFQFSQQGYMVVQFKFLHLDFRKTKFIVLHNKENYQHLSQTCPNMECEGLSVQGLSPRSIQQDNIEPHHSYPCLTLKYIWANQLSKKTRDVHFPGTKISNNNNKNNNHNFKCLYFHVRHLLCVCSCALQCILYWRSELSKIHA